MKIGVWYKGPRLKRWFLPQIGSKQLVLSFRSFRTLKQNRSRRYWQFSVWLNYRDIRELNIALRHRAAIPKALTLGFRPRLKKQLALPLLLLMSGVSGAVYFGLHLQKLNDLSLGRLNQASALVITKSVSVRAAKPLPKSLPARLTIPKIGVDTSVTELGRQANGSLAVPSQPAEVGWYQFSPTPGEMGPAIIVGHVDSLQGPAVFWRLRELQPGDIIDVNRADGSVATFIVNLLEQYPQTDFPSQAVYGSIKYAGIRLITCGGEFNLQTRHYSHNIVVYGSLRPS